MSVCHSEAVGRGNLLVGCTGLQDSAGDCHGATPLAMTRWFWAGASAWGLGGCRKMAGRVMTLPYRAEGKIFKNQLTIPKSVLKYSRYCNAIRKRSSPRHHERRRDSESLRWDQLRATFVRPERSGRALPIQSNEDAVTSAKQGGTAR